MIKFSICGFLFFLALPYLTVTATPFEGSNNNNPHRSSSGAGGRWRWRPRSSTAFRNTLATRSRTLSKMYLPFVISETVIESNENVANLEFRVDLRTLENITRASLEIATTPSPTTSDDGTVTPPPEEDGWTWKVTAETDNSSLIQPSINIGSFPSNTSSFSVVHYLRNLTLLGRNNFPPPATGDETYIVRMVFKVRRPCPSLPNCHPFLDTRVRLPFLKVDYTADIDVPGDAENALLSHLASLS